MGTNEGQAQRGWSLSPSPTAGERMPKCILIVDDHEQLRRLVRAYLEHEGGFFVCGEAVDGFDALEQAETLKPDLIVLDLSMPKMSGIEAAPRLKKMLPRTPIIMLTSYQTALRNHDAISLGIDAVIAKGGDMTLLANSVQNLLQRA
jgi:DNA-binding NarL/FixJ family response regulator